ncbi:MAG: hypothetical protein B6D62_00545 [Candidatus Cloacimonas sp. 4484_275]|nr:MAG: hypothetical protein B6D62_00545 [Candidatus Cloacimonas sp. 4484_275]RLC49885.1 MAG: hypothetical protein DRZ79_05250 [Candidatus Cloacimonadota bacterium]
MSFFKLIRPFNCLFIALTVLFGAFYRNEIFFSFPVIFAVLSAVMIGGGGYAVNDYFDYPIDKINKPHRVLPSGKIKPKTAFMFASFLFVFGIAFSFFTGNIFCVIIAILNSLFLFYYGRYYKMKFLSGNLIVAFTAASAFVYGGFSNHNVRNSFIIAIFSFLYTIIREFIKDAEDIAGDVRFRAETLAVKFGPKKTVVFSIIPTVFIIMFMNYLFYSGIISSKLFMILNLLGTIPLIFFIIYLLKNPKKKSFSRISVFMKVDMLALLFSFWFEN